MLMAFGCIWPLQFTVRPWKWQVFSGNSSFKPRLMAGSMFNILENLQKLHKIGTFIYIYTYIYSNFTLGWYGGILYFQRVWLRIIWGWIKTCIFFWYGGTSCDENVNSQKRAKVGFQLWPVVSCFGAKSLVGWKFRCHEPWLVNSRTIHGGTLLGKSWN